MQEDTGAEPGSDNQWSFVAHVVREDTGRDSESHAVDVHNRVGTSDRGSEVQASTSYAYIDSFAVISVLTIASGNSADAFVDCVSQLVAFLLDAWDWQ